MWALVRSRNKRDPLQSCHCGTSLFIFSFMKKSTCSRETRVFRWLNICPGCLSHSGDVATDHTSVCHLGQDIGQNITYRLKHNYRSFTVTAAYTSNYMVIMSLAVIIRICRNMNYLTCVTSPIDSVEWRLNASLTSHK